MKKESTTRSLIGSKPLTGPMQRKRSRDLCTKIQTPIPKVPRIDHGPRAETEPASVSPTRSGIRDERRPEEEPIIDDGDQPRHGEDSDLDGNDAGEDADMGMVREEESEEEVGVLHEDIEDEVSGIPSRN